MASKQRDKAEHKAQAKHQAKHSSDRSKKPGSKKKHGKSERAAGPQVATVSAATVLAVPDQREMPGWALPEHDHDDDEKSSATAALSLPGGPVRLDDLDTDGVRFGPQSEKAAEEAMADLGKRMADLQERLYAAGVGGARQRVLLILQGMDTAGKDGVIKHVVGMANPAGLKLTSFKQPTPPELSHDFLWRVTNALPQAGDIGVFNRSQYEDVLIVRVHELVPRAVWSKRFALINAFEREQVRRGTTIVKCFLHISTDVQKQRLAARLEDPTKYWKYNPDDINERGRWDDYQAAYTDALGRCHTIPAPWYVVPSDRKWYRNWAVAALLTEALERVDPQFPGADFDLDVERSRVAES